MSRSLLPWGRPVPAADRARGLALSRRHFLRGAAGAAVALPWLASRPGHAQSGMPHRVVFICHPNGVIPDAWFPLPGASETAFNLSPVLSPLAPYQDRLNVFSGINMYAVQSGPGEPHQQGMGGVLTGAPLNEGDFIGGDGSKAGWASSISVDQRIAQHIGQTTALPSLHLGVRCLTAEVRSRMSYLGPDAPVPPINDPAQAFDIVFSDMGTETEELQALRTRRQSVLDAVGRQFKLLNQQVSTADKQRLEQHLDFVRGVEHRLAKIGSLSGCGVPEGPNVTGPLEVGSIPDVTAAQFDIITAALACNVTHVATLQFMNAQNDVPHPWVDVTPEDPDTFTPANNLGHALSHAGPSSLSQRNELVQRHTWLMGQIAGFLERLDSIPEGEGTLLDNTVVVLVNELAVGNAHTHTNMPFLTAGGAGLGLPTGRFLEYENASHCDFLVSLLRMFDIDDATFGDPDHNTGPLSGFF